MLSPDPFLLKYVFLFFLLSACGKEDTGGTVTPTPSATLPTISIDNKSASEGSDGTSAIIFTVNLTGTYTGTVTANYQTIDGSALAGMDYEPIVSTISFTSPETSKEISIPIIADNIKETDERFVLQLDKPSTANTANGNSIIAIGIIQNDDLQMDIPEEGYSTPNTYNLWKIQWADEFDGESIDRAKWGFELGNGCNQGICGWGNNELEVYTDEEKNARIENGNLVIEAHEEGAANYTSARMLTKETQTFRFGRIDIRAKMPEGQGIWPAIWMLGANIDDAGWPACGEIDIMELVGHQPNVVHGTVHYGPPAPNNKFTGSPYSSTDGNFSDKFHVFSLVWQPGALYWYVNDVLYTEINPDKLSGQPYPFNSPFFFIMNVAVGGNWPGSPDETTIFPQRMEVDYVRVFERE